MKNIVVLLAGSINLDARVQKEIADFIKFKYRVTLLIWNWRPMTYINKNINIIDVNLSNYEFPNNTISTFWRFVKYWFISVRIIRKGDYKYIHCNDLKTLGIIFFLSKKYYKNVVYDAHELYPEMYRVNSLKFKVWTGIERHLIKRINTIIVPEINRAKYLKNKYNLSKMPYVINNFPKFQKVIPRDLRNELGISEGKKILCYQGVIDMNRGIEEIIESVQLLPETFVLILFGYTYGAYLEQLQQFIRSKRLENRIFFYGAVRPEEMLEHIAGCDISVALYRNDGMNSYLCASNKVFDSIMAGVKVITNDYPSHSMLTGNDFVSLISKNEPKLVAESVRKLVENNTEIPENIKRKFSWEQFNDLFRQIYK